MKIFSYIKVLCPLFLIFPAASQSSAKEEKLNKNDRRTESSCYLDKTPNKVLADSNKLFKGNVSRKAEEYLLTEEVTLKSGVHLKVSSGGCKMFFNEIFEVSSITSLESTQNYQKHLDYMVAFFEQKIGRKGKSLNKSLAELIKNTKNVLFEDQLTGAKRECSDKECSLEIGKDSKLNEDSTKCIIKIRRIAESKIIIIIEYSYPV